MTASELVYAILRLDVSCLSLPVIFPDGETGGPIEVESVSVECGGDKKGEENGKYIRIKGNL